MLGWITLSLAAALASIAATFMTASFVAGEMDQPDPTVTLGLYIAAAVSLALLWPALRACLAARAAEPARVRLADVRDWSLRGLGLCVPVWLILAAAAFVSANGFAVGHTLFEPELIRDTAPLVIAAFRYNVEIFLLAEAVVLVWGLLVALARLAPGPAAAPIRFAATVYCDLFRAIPTIVAVYLIAFGLPLTGLALFRDLSPILLAVLALTLSYGAYVSEVYRAGVQSVHWSQAAAARSLGLSYLQTMRHVVVPQAVRRIIPPLLNDFISLQKDTAIVSVAGTVEAFNQAKIIAGTHFNLSAVTTVALLFILITIPQTRLADRLIERDRRRSQAEG
jgi:polar amino acid transport system permease protein